MDKEQLRKPIEDIQYFPVGRQLFEQGITRQEAIGYPVDENGEIIKYPWMIYMNREESDLYTGLFENGEKVWTRLPAPAVNRIYGQIGDQVQSAIVDLEQATDDDVSYKAEQRIRYWQEMQERFEENPRLWSQIQRT